RHRIEHRARARVLRGGPGRHLRVSGVFEPAIGIVHGDAVIGIGDVDLWRRHILRKQWRSAQEQRQGKRGTASKTYHGRPHSAGAATRALSFSTPLTRIAISAV